MIDYISLIKSNKKYFESEKLIKIFNEMKEEVLKLDVQIIINDKKLSDIINKRPCISLVLHTSSE